VRALEGELARTIQLMRGVKAPGAHIVMADEVNMVPGGFGAWTANGPRIPQ
jgi:flagellar biosynthesis/type III secretory pathway M-ring protein FliF/YscJ